MENYIKFKYVRLYQMFDNNKRYTQKNCIVDVVNTIY